MKKYLLFLVGIVSLVSFGQDGSPDLSFGTEGVVTTDIENSEELLSSVVQQIDQKLIVSGITLINNSITKPYLIRYMPDGTLDNSFGNNGVLVANYAEGYSENVNLFLDEQQNILTGGKFSVNQNQTYKIAKYNSNGELINSFGDNGVLTIPNGNFSKMLVLADNSLLFLKLTANDEIGFFHYLENGSLDTNFGINGVAISNFLGGSFTIKELKVDAENNLFVLGIRDYSYSEDIILMKFLSTGYIDVNFGDNGTTTKTFESIDPMDYRNASFDFTHNQKIVIAGSYGYCNMQLQPFFHQYFIRYLSDGQTDLNFGNNGTQILSDTGFTISQLIIQENQRMLAIGSTTDCFELGEYTVKRYFPGGYRDYSLNIFLEFVDSKTIVQDDGKIVGTGITPFLSGVQDVLVARFNNSQLSVPEFQNQKKTIYPNPSNGIFTIERHLYSENEAYQITDVTGKIIALGELNEKQSQIDISAAQSGIYFLQTSNSVFRLLKN